MGCLISASAYSEDLLTIFDQAVVNDPLVREAEFTRKATREARPQAWAAGAPVLLLQVLLGLRPDRARHALETLAPGELPSWVGRRLRLTGVRAFDRQWDVRVEDGHVTVEEA
jgi:glycogen debranching enzyme